MLAGRRVVLGVTGGVAAYKAAYLARRLIERGAVVRTVMTESATRFLGPHTLAALTGTPPVVDLFAAEDVSPHTTLGRWADVVVVAPATAATLARLARGLSDDAVAATVLATDAPVVIAPAMHTEMWEQPAVQENVQVLAARGVEIVGPDEGRLAGGDVGAGRLAEPMVIVEAVERALSGGGRDLEGRTVLVTAGGTREPICPVRYIGNRSSGKQGHALAAEAAARGAKVLCVSTAPEHAPVASTIEVIAVETAAEMAAAVGHLAPGADYVFMAAAVADFRPVEVSDEKIKKADGLPEIRLEPTADILAELGRTRTSGQVIVGFAAETTDLRQNAAAKLAAKGADLIVANDVTAPDTGFDHDTNAVVLLDADGGEAEVPLAGKRQVARAVLDAAVDIRRRRMAGGGVGS